MRRKAEAQSNDRNLESVPLIGMGGISNQVIGNRVISRRS
jgi:hypothetical protein